MALSRRSERRQILLNKLLSIRDGISALIQSIMLAPTLSENMMKVDSKGRIPPPEEIRDRLGLTPCTEVEVHEKDGKAVLNRLIVPKRLSNAWKNSLGKQPRSVGRDHRLRTDPAQLLRSIGTLFGAE
jgi:AbrB family looped-hinge helix DNA binding protein